MIGAGGNETQHLSLPGCLFIQHLVFVVEGGVLLKVVYSQLVILIKQSSWQFVALVGLIDWLSGWLEVMFLSEIRKSIC